METELGSRPPPTSGAIARRFGGWTISSLLLLIVSVVMVGATTTLSWWNLSNSNGYTSGWYLGMCAPPVRVKTTAGTLRCMTLSSHAKVMRTFNSCRLTSFPRVERETAGRRLWQPGCPSLLSGTYTAVVSFLEAVRSRGIQHHNRLSAEGPPVRLIRGRNGAIASPCRHQGYGARHSRSRPALAHNRTLRAYQTFPGPIQSGPSPHARCTWTPSHVMPK